MVYKKFVVCVDGLHLKNGKMLMLKRAKDPFKGFWSLVGGHVNGIEGLKEALRREFKEETNLDVQVGNLLGERVEETCDRTKRVLTFEVTSARGEIRLSQENEEYGWFDRAPENSVYDYAEYIKKESSF
jgi:ADP-ribose pyrophosphatase YjhB (NUDIX family)